MIFFFSKDFVGIHNIWKIQFTYLFIDNHSRWLIYQIAWIAIKTYELKTELALPTSGYSKITKSEEISSKNKKKNTTTDHISTHCVPIWGNAMSIYDLLSSLIQKEGNKTGMKQVLNSGIFQFPSKT